MYLAVLAIATMMSLYLIVLGVWIYALGRITD